MMPATCASDPVASGARYKNAAMAWIALGGANTSLEVRLGGAHAGSQANGRQAGQRRGAAVLALGAEWLKPTWILIFRRTAPTSVCSFSTCTRRLFAHAAI